MGKRSAYIVMPSDAPRRSSGGIFGADTPPRQKLYDPRYCMPIHFMNVIPIDFRPNWGGVQDIEPLHSLEIRLQFHKIRWWQV